MYNTFNASSYGEFDVAQWPMPTVAPLCDLYRDDFGASVPPLMHNTGGGTGNGLAMGGCSGGAAGSAAVAAAGLLPGRENNNPLLSRVVICEVEE